MANKPKTKLVEYHDENGPHRVILPVESNNVDLGIPYGVPFEAINFPIITPARVARTLREHGISDLSEVEMAVLEVDGSISVIPVGINHKRVKKPIKFLRNQ